VTKVVLPGSGGIESVFTLEEYEAMTHQFLESVSEAWGNDPVDGLHREGQQAINDMLANAVSHAFRDSFAALRRRPVRADVPALRAMIVELAVGYALENLRALNQQGLQQEASPC
jgi:hypothetical protein